MYAVIKVGGKQYRVEEGQRLLVDRQPHAAGKSFTPDVLMTGGDDVVTDGKKLAGTVTAEVVEHLRGEKVKVFTFKPKRGFKKTRGHRSELTRISIASIGTAKPKRAPAKKAAPADEAAEKPKPARKPRAAAAKPAAKAPAKAAAKPAATKPATRSRTKKETPDDGA
jgi:large subunit ribosomal protein L21